MVCFHHQLFIVKAKIISGTRYLRSLSCLAFFTWFSFFFLTIISHFFKNYFLGLSLGKNLFLYYFNILDILLILIPLLTSLLCSLIALLFSKPRGSFSNPGPLWSPGPGKSGCKRDCPSCRRGVDTSSVVLTGRAWCMSQTVSCTLHPSFAHREIEARWREGQFQSESGSQDKICPCWMAYEK